MIHTRETTPSLNQYERGRLGELAAAKHFAEQGGLVLWPMGEAAYDFAVDDGRQILRVQVKSSGSLDSRGRMRFCLRRGGNQAYPEGSVDLFALYNALTDEVRVYRAEDMKKNKYWEDGNA